MSLFGSSILAVWDGGWDLTAGRGWMGARRIHGSWSGKSRGSHNRDSRYESSEILGWQVGDLEGFGEIGSVWYFLFCWLRRVACLLAGRRGGDDGRLAGTVYSGSIFRIWAFWRWAFVSSLPQVGGVGGGLPVDVVVRASFS